MNDLFAAAEDDRRERLRARGWRDLGSGLSRGVRQWRRPDGATIDEPEAFRQLAALEAE